MRLRNILFAVLGVIVLLVAGLAISIMTLDFGRFRGLIAAQIEQASGRAVTFEGKLAFSLWPRASVTLRDVTLANASWGSRPHMLKLGVLSAQVELWPLVLRRSLQVTRLVASDGDLLLETREDGRGNWDLSSDTAPDTAGDPPAAGVATGANGLPTVDDVQLSNISVTWRHGATGQVQTALLKQVSIAGGPVGRIAVRAEGSWRDETIALVAAIDEPDGFLAPGGPFTGTAELTLPGAVVKLSGSIANARAGTGLDMAVAIEAASAATLGGIVERALPAVKFNLAAQIAGDVGQALRVSALKVVFGRSDLAGSAVLHRSGVRPRLVAELTAERLDLVEATASERPTSPEPTPPADTEAASRLASAPALDFSRLRGFDAAINLRIAAVHVLAARAGADTGAIALHDASLRAVLEDGELKVRPFAFTIGASHVAGDARLDVRPAVPQLALDIAAQQFELEGLLVLAIGRPLLSAKGDLVVAVRGAGVTPRAVLASLDGNASLVVGQGTLAPNYIDMLGLAALRTAGPQFQRVLDARLNCAIARFDIARGVATARMMVIDAGDLSILGTGTVNLGTEALAIDLAPRLKLAGLAGVTVPVQVRGTMTDPTVATVLSRGPGARNLLQSLGAIVLDPGASRANPCAGLAELPARRAPLPAPGAAAPGVVVPAPR